jgi:hypothetical protein
VARKVKSIEISNDEDLTCSHSFSFTVSLSYLIKKFIPVYWLSTILGFHSGGFLLLLVYAIIFIVPPGIAPQAHHDHEEHGVDIEKDPCHIAIYHPGSQGGCKHKNHITRNCPECERSHVTLVRQLVVETATWVDFSIKTDIEHLDFSEAAIYIALPDHHDRGPPDLNC